MNKIIMPKNLLKAKVGNGGFDQENIKRAQESIDNNDTDFSPIAATYLGSVRLALAEFSQTQDAERLYNDLLDQLTQLRAQGSMFKYSAITLLTDIVVDLLDALKIVDDKIIQIVDAYERSTTILLKSGVKSADHDISKALAREIETVCKKYKLKYAAK